MKKLICHCGKVELEIKESEGALNKFLRCNCTLCKKKGYIMTFAPIKDVKIMKGEDKLKLYQYHTKVAEHYFCQECGIYTHHKMRSRPDTFGLNVGCIKHAHHNFEIDKPGKDSWRHREAGSQEVIVSSSKRIAHIIEHEKCNDAELYELLLLQKR